MSVVYSEVMLQIIIDKVLVLTHCFFVFFLSDPDLLSIRPINLFEVHSRCSLCPKQGRQVQLFSSRAFTMLLPLSVVMQVMLFSSSPHH